MLFLIVSYARIAPWCLAFITSSDLAKSFNRMTVAVRNFLDRERSFSRYASHELRTPIATLKVQIEALEQGLLPKEEALPTIKASLERLERRSVDRVISRFHPLRRGSKIGAQKIDVKHGVFSYRSGMWFWT